MIEKLSDELASLYKAHIPEYIDNLKKAIETEDLITMQDIAHNLSSAMGSIGDMESSALFKQIEKEKMSLIEIKTVLAEAEKLSAKTILGI